jgi:hypothetical protein
VDSQGLELVVCHRPDAWCLEVAPSLLENLSTPSLVQTLFIPVCSFSCSHAETSCSCRILLRVLNHAFQLHFFPFYFAIIHFCVFLSNTCPFNSLFCPPVSLHVAVRETLN